MAGIEVSPIFKRNVTLEIEDTNSSGASASLIAALLPNP